MSKKPLPCAAWAEGHARRQTGTYPKTPTNAIKNWWAQGTTLRLNIKLLAGGRRSSTVNSRRPACRPAARGRAAGPGTGHAGWRGMGHAGRRGTGHAGWQGGGAACRVAGHAGWRGMGHGGWMINSFSARSMDGRVGVHDCASNIQPNPHDPCSKLTPCSKHTLNPALP
jgi:hypothetical protein